LRYNFKNKPVNTYYRQNLPSGMDVVLTSSGERNEIILQLDGVAGGQYASCVLTEQQQDDLIAGILERRGVKIHAIKSWLRYSETLDRPFPISSDGQQQSKIHPDNKTVENKS
jgi:hypothetical protein